MKVKNSAAVKEYMKILRPCFHFHGIQIKSEEVFRNFAYHLSEMEAIAGIHCCTISLEDIFVCPEIGIDNEDFVVNTPMESLLVDLIRKFKG
jgi:hypothetical protein